MSYPGPNPVRSSSVIDTFMGSGDVPTMLKTMALLPDPIAYIANRIAEGTATTIDFYGDSIYYGYLNGGTRATTTSLAQLQSNLGIHYTGSNATINNFGVTGNGTTDVIGTWSATMAASTAQAVVIGFGVNDAQGANSAAISATQYATNLRTMVIQARAAGKIVLLDTPLAIQPFGSLGTQTKSERVKHFAQAMREVGTQMGVPVIDTNKFVEIVLRGTGAANAWTVDGIHPTQAAYLRLGYWYSSQFFRGPEISDPGFVSCTHPAFRFWNGSAVYANAAGSKFGQGLIANRISIPFTVTQPGLDIYMAVPYWSGGTTAWTITLNAVNVVGSTISLLLSGTSGFPVDREIMVAQNIAPGSYMLETQGVTATDGGFYYLRATPTRKNYLINGASVGTSPTITTSQALGDLTMSSPSDASGQNHVFTSIPISNLVADTVIKFNATLQKNTGIAFFGGPMSDNTYPRSGYTMFVAASTGFLTIATATFNSYTNITALGAVDLSLASHEYMIYIHTSGVIDCYVDAVLIGSYTPATTLYRGGYIGAYISGASLNVTLNNLRVI